MPSPSLPTEGAGVKPYRGTCSGFARAKVATDTDKAAKTRATQALLGHTTEAMTADYIRHKMGRKVAVAVVLRNSARNCGSFTTLLIANYPR